jgi:hypothetical protein
MFAVTLRQDVAALDATAPVAGATAVSKVVTSANLSP